MRKLALAATAAIAIASSASAHNFNGDLFCSVQDPQGRSTGWTFDNNTWNSDGTLGTMVETGVYKMNGQTVSNATGSRPIWIIFYNKVGGLTLQWRQDPSWFIGMDTPTGNGNWSKATAHLFHNRVEVATGQCGRAAPQTASNVGDQGAE